ncbi:Coiled-coil domain-containing protein 6 [Amphibalanus amphitrite]|uniref:Coiled-coil domain-containing protein 6 n=1 Tax=Amphibalanus amphitrite TaxID=1232801 RepID=A0A6A4VGS6_AMPAM|nr:coiled-coil domain-containing protein 6-like [Amphibalanus amphitrite]KAF0292349.1 Coiled-coil domain-containing protein 6 [Amphibalanus amphitrite]
MADSASESDSGSVDGGSILMPPSPITREQLQKRIESLAQQNRVLKVELDTYKLRVKGLQEENRALKQASVNIQARAEQEEEFISNTLLKKIQALKKEKETLAINYEQEEECLTNDLSRKLSQLRHEKEHLEQTLEQEQECLVNKLMNKIQKLESQTLNKQTTLEQLRREKVELENTLEQEQEALVNKLWKKMEKLEAEKRLLSGKLERVERGSDSEPPSPGTPATSTASATGGGGGGGGGGAEERERDSSTAGDLSLYIQQLRREVLALKSQLQHSRREHSVKMAQYAQEERHVREENQRLTRRLQVEMDRRDTLCRHLSESESSLDMDEERQLEMSAGSRPRTVSSPGPASLTSPGGSRPLSPGRDMFGPPSPVVPRCQNCGATVQQMPPRPRPPTLPPSGGAGNDKFVKPTAPAISIGAPAMSPGRPMQMSPTLSSGRAATPTDPPASPSSTVPGSPMDTSRA